MDRLFMKRALTLAARARGMTSPNPMVGAVIVRDGKVIAEDFHKRPGALHAEALALQQAQGNAQNATLYVTLEPCCHKDKRTPPCTGIIIESGIKRVFVAMEDPNPKVAGKGIAELRKHGIAVAVGIMEKRAKELNESYIKFITTGMPFVTLKVAMTLDGKIATPEGQSKWITGERARKIVHEMRSGVDALLTAIGTVKADDPSFTARPGRTRKVKDQQTQGPRRIIIDSELETPPDYKVCSVPPETMLVTRKMTGNAAVQQRAGILTSKGVKILEYEGERVDLKWLMKKLGDDGVTSVMIEGGASINASALNDGIVDKVVFFIAPKIIGNKDSVPAVGGHLLRKLEDAFRLHDLHVRMVGADVMVEGYL
jgi:diaminohydroxyphosphoribosylaminopyrimidine deaminase/5-amino-6-(5-phosphoribosylamino)uracil reductase